MFEVKCINLEYIRFTASRTCRCLIFGYQILYFVILVELTRTGLLVPVFLKYHCFVYFCDVVRAHLLTLLFPVEDLDI